MKVERRLEALEQKIFQIEGLERRELATGKQKVRAVVICSTAEPPPTGEEIKIARAEFVEVYGDPPRNALINSARGTTTASLNGQYISLPYSDRLSELRIWGALLVPNKSLR